VRWLAALALTTALAATTQTAHAQGVYLPSIGPTNQSFGGAATAAPIDSAGALYWNPATLSGLKSSEMALGLGIVLAALRSSRRGSDPFPGSTSSDAGGDSRADDGLGAEGPTTRPGPTASASSASAASA